MQAISAYKNWPTHVQHQQLPIVLFEHCRKLRDKVPHGIKYRWFVLCYKFWNALSFFKISLSLSNSVRYTNEFVVFKPEHLLAKCVFIRDAVCQ